MAAVLPLPLVPAMWTNFSFFSGLPILARRVCVRPRPGMLPFQQTEWMYSMACAAFMEIRSFQIGYFSLETGGQMPMRVKMPVRMSR